MTIRTIITVVWTLPLLLLIGCEQKQAPPVSAVPTSHMAHFEAQGSFEDVRDYIRLAITGRGIKINNVSHIGNMLSRTAEAVGASKTVYTHAEAIEFCSSTISRDTMEADPHNIVFCPYIIAVYALPGEEDKVHVAYRRPTPVGTDASKESLLAVEALLDGIVREAIQ